MQFQSKYTRGCKRAAGVIALMTMLVMTPPLIADDQGEKSSSKAEWWQTPSKIEKLGLSESQVTFIAEIEERFEPLITESRRARVKAYRHVVRLLDNPNYTPEDLDTKTRAFQDAFADEVQVKVDHWAELRSILDDDQWKNLPTVAPQDMVIGGFGISARGKIFVGGPGAPRVQAGPTGK